MITITTAVREYKKMLECEDLASSTKEKYSSTVDHLIAFMKNTNKMDSVVTPEGKERD